MKKLFVILFVILTFVACKKDTKLEAYKVVINDEITTLSSTNATLVVNYIYISKLNLKLLYSTNTNMSDSESLETMDNDNVFTYNLGNLVPKTRYYYCIEYNNGLSTEKSEIKSFDTPESPVDQVLVTVKTVTEITATSAKSGGTIQVVGDVQIIGRGICYSIIQNPTINDNITSNGDGAGAFESELIELQGNTTYYIKAYAATSDSIYYSDELSFTTLNYALPAISTNQVTDITNTTALCGGNVTYEGDGVVTVKGICWNTSNNPTINDNYTTNGNGLGVYTSQINDLLPNTTYFVRAYATNQHGTSYGETLSFTTLDNYFSVSAVDKVLFSSGNLQYNPAANIWRFAENQYDYIGDDNQNISPNYNGWLDLFGWATSGYNGCYPWLHSTNQAHYAGTITSLAETSYDWGIFNQISGSSGNWRTLTISEWDYILNQRENASNLRSQATVCGMQGLIILPDNWVQPSDTSFIPNASDWTTNTYNAYNWTFMNDSNAIFLPAAGYRSDINIYALYVNGGYWASDASDYKTALFLIFTESTFNLTSSSRHIGRSVRLVKDY